MPYFTGVIVDTERDGSLSALSHDKYCFPLRGLLLPPRSGSDLRSAGTFRSVWWQLLTDVSGQPRVLPATLALYQPYWLASCLLRPIAAAPHFPLCQLNTICYWLSAWIS